MLTRIVAYCGRILAASWPRGAVLILLLNLLAVSAGFAHCNFLPLGFSGWLTESSRPRYFEALDRDSFYIFQSNPSRGSELPKSTFRKGQLEND
jgi:hypothetical protein